LSDRYTGPDNRGKSPGEDEQRAQTAKVFWALSRACSACSWPCGAYHPASGHPATAADVSLQAIGVVMGIVGYRLYPRRLGIATIVLCVVAILFGLVVSQGLIPGLGHTDRDLPDAEPGA
jgi:hypothetical protein